MNGRSGLRVGSLSCRVHHSGHRYAGMLAQVFGTHLDPDRDDASPDIEFFINETPSDPSVADMKRDQMVVTKSAGGYLLETDPIVCRLESSQAPAQVSLTVRQPEMRGDWLAFHFVILTNRLLLLLDRLILHAAALQFDGRVNIFSGPEGAGKSTLAIALARTGAVLLAEDLILVSRRDDGFHVSGCSDRMRVTPQTEQHFLDGDLPPGTVIVSGTSKKEFSAGHLFHARPHQDYRPSRLFFNRVGARLHVQPLSKREATLRLMRNARGMLRFAEPADYAQFLNYLADFTGCVPAFDLELSNRLEDLDELVHHLRDSV